MQLLLRVEASGAFGVGKCAGTEVGAARAAVPGAVSGGPRGREVLRPSESRSCQERERERERESERQWDDEGWQLKKGETK